MFCPKCGTKIVDNDDFCTKCGNLLLNKNIGKKLDFHENLYQNIQNIISKNTQIQANVRRNNMRYLLIILLSIFVIILGIVYKNPWFGIIIATILIFILTFNRTVKLNHKWKTIGALVFILFMSFAGFGNKIREKEEQKKQLERELVLQRQQEAKKLEEEKRKKEIQIYNESHLEEHYQKGLEFIDKTNWIKAIHYLKLVESVRPNGYKDSKKKISYCKIQYEAKKEEERERKREQEQQEEEEANQREFKRRIVNEINRQDPTFFRRYNIDPNR